MLPFLRLVFIIALLVSIVQVGWKVSTKPMKPELSKFNPINGFKRMFSKDSVFELVKSIIKIGLIAYMHMHPFGIIRMNFLFCMIWN